MSSKKVNSKCMRMKGMPYRWPQEHPSKSGRFRFNGVAQKAPEQKALRHCFHCAHHKISTPTQFYSETKFYAQWN